MINRLQNTARARGCIGVIPSIRFNQKTYHPPCAFGYDVECEIIAILYTSSESIVGAIDELFQKAQSSLRPLVRLFEKRDQDELIIEP